MLSELTDRPSTASGSNRRTVRGSRGGQRRSSERPAGPTVEFSRALTLADPVFGLDVGTRYRSAGGGLLRRRPSGVPVDACQLTGALRCEQRVVGGRDVLQGPGGGTRRGDLLERGREPTRHGPVALDDRHGRARTPQAAQA